MQTQTNMTELTANPCTQVVSRYLCRIFLNHWVGAWRSKAHFAFCGEYEVNYRKKCPTRQDNGTLMNVYWLVIVQGSQKKCIRENWGRMRIIASGLYLCQRWSDFCMLISRNSLEANRGKVWAFIPTLKVLFSTGITSFCVGLREAN